MANIFLSVPILGKPELKMIYSMYQAILSCKDHRVRVHFNENDSLISRVRNVHLSVFLYDFPECDYFMSLDSDLQILNCFPDNNIFTKLISHDKDFVGGLYALKNPSMRRCSSIPMEGENIKFNGGLAEMRWLSTGCWCLKRSAVEKMVKHYPELIYQGDDNVVGKTIHGLYIPYIKAMTHEEFPKSVAEGTIFNKYLSEDWAFPVDPSTLVLQSNSKWKRIDECNVNDKVTAFDEYPVGQKRQIKISTVENIIEKKLPRYKITTTNGEIITTSDHKWLIKRKLNNKENSHKGYWAKTKDISTGDQIYKPFEVNKNSYSFDKYKEIPQNQETILSIKSIGVGNVMCLVTDSSTFIANGFASHNCDRWIHMNPNNKIWADTSIILEHIGKHHYKLWDVDIVQQQQSMPPPGHNLTQNKNK